MQYSSRRSLTRNVHIKFPTTKDLLVVSKSVRQVGLEKCKTCVFLFLVWRTVEYINNSVLYKSEKH